MITQIDVLIFDRYRVVFPDRIISGVQFMPGFVTGCIAVCLNLLLKGHDVAWRFSKVTVHLFYQSLVIHNYILKSRGSSLASFFMIVTTWTLNHMAQIT